MESNTGEQQLSDAFATYQREKGLTSDTIRRRRVTLGRFAAHIAPGPLATARTDDIDDFLATLRAPATKRAYCADLFAFYRWAMRRRLVDVNPAADIDRMRVPKGLPRPVRKELLPAILEAADPELRKMIALAAYAGLRVSEIAKLDRDDLSLDVDEPIVIVREGKGRKDRIVPAHPALVEMLRDFRQPGRLFPVTKGYIGAKIAAHLRELGIEATAHKLRHTFGTEAVRAARGNIVLAAYLMGHDSIETTMKYNGWAGGPAGDVIRSMFPPAPPAAPPTAAA